MPGIVPTQSVGTRNEKALAAKHSREIHGFLTIGPDPGNALAVGSDGGLSKHRNEHKSTISCGVSWVSNESGMSESTLVFISATCPRWIVSTWPP